MSSTDFLFLIKKAAIEAVEASKPVKIEYGKVAKTSPLEILVEQKKRLDIDFLVITNAAKEAGLAVGDKVVLLQQQGGQMYIVLDKVVEE